MSYHFWGNILQHVKGKGKEKNNQGVSISIKKGQRPHRSTKLRVNPARQMSRSCKSCSPADGRPHRRRFRHQLSSLMNFKDEFLRLACEVVWPAASYVSHGHRWWHWQLALLQSTEPSDVSGQLCHRRCGGNASFGHFCSRNERKD